MSAPPAGELSGQSYPDQGEDPRIEQLLQFVCDNQDDEFYHVTCHVDSRLKQRIQKGEYVELETLIPKAHGQLLKDDERLQQYVTKGGYTYWAPPERETKISNIRKWEQAFRVFAAIYCQANLTRSVEIWQYVHTINSAAVSFDWENVYYYDITFRQMMAERPTRSWAKTYSQLWHAAMCDPLPKGGPPGRPPSNSSGRGGGSKYNDWKDRCCWCYNRGKCRKWNCGFGHRCSTCGSYSHYYKTCNKQKSGGGSSVSTSGRGRSKSRSQTPPRKTGKKNK